MLFGILNWGSVCITIGSMLKRFLSAGYYSLHKGQFAYKDPLRWVLSVEQRTI